MVNNYHYASFSRYFLDGVQKKLKEVFYCSWKYNAFRWIFVYVLKCGGSIACDRNLKAKTEFAYLLGAIECL